MLVSIGWFSPNLYIENGWKSPFPSINEMVGCLGFQVVKKGTSPTRLWGEQLLSFLSMACPTFIVTCFPKIVGFLPQSIPFFYGDFTTINHPIIWGTPIFGNTHLSILENERMFCENQWLGSMIRFPETKWSFVWGETCWLPGGGGKWDPLGLVPFFLGVFF